MACIKQSHAGIVIFVFCKDCVLSWYNLCNSIQLKVSLLDASSTGFKQPNFQPEVLA